MMTTTRRSNFAAALRTTLLLGFLTGLLVVIGALIGGPRMALIFLFLAAAMNFAAYWFSDRVALAMARAKPVDESEAPRLYQTVRELTTRADLPMPRLYMIPHDQPNAFATGRSPKRAAVAVTRGITRLLSEDELRGVLAHELAHVRNRDILIGSVAAAVATGISLVANMAMWGAMLGGGRHDGERGNPIGLLATALLAPIAAGLLQMALSRSREFEADRSGADLIGTGEPLASALEKLEVYAGRVPMDVSPAQAQAFIVNPLTGRHVSFANLFRTHPTTAERVARLRQRART